MKKIMEGHDKAARCQNYFWRSFLVLFPNLVESDQKSSLVAPP